MNLEFNIGEIARIPAIVLSTHYCGNTIITKDRHYVKILSKFDGKYYEVEYGCVRLLWPVFLMKISPLEQLGTIA